MTLQITEYKTIGYMAPAAFAPPTAVTNLTNSGTLTIAGTVGEQCVVRILAKGSDPNIVWSTDADGETFKEGLPEFRVIAAGTVITCAAVS